MPEDLKDSHTAQQPEVLSSIVSSLLAFGLSEGLTLEAAEQATGLSAWSLLNPETRLPDSVLPKLWIALSALGPDRAMPLEMARGAPMSYFGGLATAARFAPDLRSCLNFLVENKTVLSDRLHIALEEAGTVAAFSLSHPNDVIDHGRQREASVAICWRFISNFVDRPDTLRTVELNSERQGTKEAYGAFFGAPVSFAHSRDGCALILPRDLLDEPGAHSNAAAFMQVREVFMQSRHRARGCFGPQALGKLRAAISENANRGDFSVKSAAFGAHQSLRSAQRLAAQHGRSLTGLIDEARAERAKLEIWDNPHVTLATVAYRLGFSDDRSFRRAFKRWTGQTPSQYKRSVR